jgi:16S rRNA (uracil1498-N3)-methyltransferase
MTPPLFLVDELPAGGRVGLTGEEGRHAARVHRIAVGEMLQLGDGRGGLATCSVTAVLPDGLELHIESRRVVPVPDPRVIVVQALIKGDGAERAVQAMTELGVDEIVPWAASRSVEQWHGARGTRSVERWRRIAREAAKQSRRAWVPPIADLAATADVAARAATGPTLVLHEAATDPLVTAALPSSGSLTVVVGPEGGITDDELAAFVAPGGIPVRLGSPVLRASTAGTAALAALAVRLGRWA